MQYSFPLDSTIYDIASIHQSIEDFKEVSSLNFSDNMLNIVTDSESEAKEIFLEFCNYILSL